MLAKLGGNDPSNNNINLTRKSGATLAGHHAQSNSPKPHGHPTPINTNNAKLFLKGFYDN